MIKRAVAYCRISSEHDDQLNSLENQKLMWLDYINKHEGLTFCRLYVDEGITGTSTTKRVGFNKMIENIHPLGIFSTSMRLAEEA